MKTAMNSKNDNYTQSNQYNSKKNVKAKSSVPKLSIGSTDPVKKLNDIIISIRTGILFDAQRQRRVNPKYLKDILAKTKNYVLKVSRLENTIMHQRVFEAILELGKINENGEQIIIDNIYELKKLAGMNVFTSDQEVVNIIKDLMTVIVEVIKYDETADKYIPFAIFHIIGKTYGLIENQNQKIKGLMVEVDKDFLKLTNSLTTVKINKELLSYIHTKVKSAYVEKLIKYFITQNKGSSWDIWTLLKNITDYTTMKKDEYKLDELSQRHKRRILEQIEKESDTLKEFGIFFSKKENKIYFYPEKSQHKKQVFISYSDV